MVRIVAEVSRYLRILIFPPPGSVFATEDALLGGSLTLTMICFGKDYSLRSFVAHVRIVLRSIASLSLVLLFDYKQLRMRSVIVFDVRFAHFNMLRSRGCAHLMLRYAMLSHCF